MAGMDVAELIRALGGPTAVGRRRGVRSQAVSMWIARRVIPAEHHMDLWAMAREKGVDWRPPGAPAPAEAA